ncbi:MAG TPA: JAB domain-containing protein [Herpetosiphonaceae bacterium]
MARRKRSDEQRLREAVAPYLDLRHLRRLAATEGANLREALRVKQPPPEVQAILDVLAHVLRPHSGARITTPDDVAALLLVEMSCLDQQQLRVICLDTTGQVLTIQTVYQGSLSDMPVRVGELFREAIRRNSASIILAHNHPSGDPTPSEADTSITRQIVVVGRLHNIAVHDHLVIGRGRWMSLRREQPQLFT